MAQKDNEPVIAPVSVTMTSEQLQALIAGAVQAAGMAAPAGVDLKTILDAQLESQRAMLQANTESQRQIAEAARPQRHSNPDHRHESAFEYPEGGLKRKKPDFLKGANGQPREVFFNYHRESIDDLTPSEIDAYNAITASCTSREERGEEGMWKAKVTPNRLEVFIPSFTADDRADMHNGLALNLMELAKGRKAADPVNMMAELADLRERLAKLEPAGASA